MIDARCRYGYHNWEFNSRTGIGKCKRDGCTAIIHTKSKNTPVKT